MTSYVTCEPVCDPADLEEVPAPSGGGGSEYRFTQCIECGLLRVVKRQEARGQVLTSTQIVLKTDAWSGEVGR